MCTHHKDSGKLYLLLDNARSNYTQAVAEAARLYVISLDYLRPYSPNLNPVERLWKFVRKHFFKDKYYSTFTNFCAQLQKFFANLDPYRQQLASLITDHFELIPAG